MDKIQFLQSILGQGQKANRDFYQFTCPFCQHYKKKLGVSLEHGYYKCWVCGSKGNVIGLIKKLRLDASKIDIAKTLFKITSNRTHQFHPTVDLPKDYKPLWIPSKSFFYNRARNYLLDRGLSELDFLKYRIGYCENGSYDKMIIIPNYNESGQLDFFIGRNYEPNPRIKFKDSSADKNIIGDELLINWQEPLILCESKLDAIVIKRNAIPLFGKQMSKKLKEKLIEEETQEVYLCLDGDAQREIMKNSEFFIKNGITVYKVQLPNEHDPTSLGYNEVWKYINDASQINENELFKFNILEKLK